MPQTSLRQALTLPLMRGIALMTIQVCLPDTIRLQGGCRQSMFVEYARVNIQVCLLDTIRLQGMIASRVCLSLW
jgi:hypothetical protein